MENTVYLEDLTVVRSFSRENSMGVIKYYNVYGGSNTDETFTITRHGLFAECLDSIGGLRNKITCSYNTRNNQFDLENDCYYCFSNGSYGVCYDKKAGSYSKVSLGSGFTRFNSSFSFTKDDVDRIINNRKKKGLRYG